jgi:hypothetical protein
MRAAACLHASQQSPSRAKSGSRSSRDAWSAPSHPMPQAREVPWETYVTARLITDKDLSLIRRLDKRSEELRASMLDEASQAALRMDEAAQLTMHRNKEASIRERGGLCTSPWNLSGSHACPMQPSDSSACPW